MRSVALQPRFAVEVPRIDLMDSSADYGHVKCDSALVQGLGDQLCCVPIGVLPM